MKSSCLFICLGSLLVESTFGQSGNGGGVVTTTITPTCDSVEIQNANDCGLACRDMGEDIDLTKSRDVNGQFKCYCSSTTVCNDDPLCSDLLVVPGMAQERCTAVCPEGTATVNAQDDVELVGEGANKNQTHFRVNCYCDDAKQCDTEYILFSDLSFLPACSSASSDPGTLNINSDAECSNYCTSMTFDGSVFDTQATSCTCMTASGGSALACDDTKANSERPDSIGCFQEVGVSTFSCPPTPAPTTEGGGDSGSSFVATSVTMTLCFVWLSSWAMMLQ